MFDSSFFQHIYDFLLINIFVNKLNNNLTSKHYGNGTTSLVSVLNSVLTFTNIPYPQSIIFSVQSSEGYYICRATAWNRDWIGGVATPGISSQNKSFSFIRKASGGADTVVNFISNAPTAATFIYNFSAYMHGQQSSKSIAINNYYDFYIIIISGNWVNMSVCLTKTNGSTESKNYSGTVNTCMIIPTKDYVNVLLDIFTDANDFAHTVNVFALK